MTGTIIENISGRKLFALVTFLTLGQITCFLVGGFVSPAPETAQSILASVCKDTWSNKNDTTKWFYNRGKGKCKTIDLIINQNSSEVDIVYVVQIPVPRKDKILEYTKWQQNLIGVLSIDIPKHIQEEMVLRKMITIDARLGYRNKGDPEDEWKLYAKSLEKRNLDCEAGEDMYYRCSTVPLFELGSLSHDYYLLNIKLTVDTDTKYYKGHVQGLWLTVINQSESFTKVWVSLKTVFFFSFIYIICWFWRRAKKLLRKFVLLETMLLSLGVTTCLLNMPMEFLNLYFDLSLLLLIGDIRQTVFYAKLLSFWLVFTGEHMLIQTQSSFKQYWAHIIVVVMSCIFLFIFDICERGMQLSNPFYSIWISDLGFNFNLALTFMIMSRILIGLYFLFLCYKAWQVLVNIHRKRRQYLLSMSTVRKLHYEGIIYRFKILLLVTLVCAALSLIGIILGQAAEWKMEENIKVENTSAFFTGLYGMWNIYILALFILYAPSHKNWGAAEAAIEGLQVAI